MHFVILYDDSYIIMLLSVIHLHIGQCMNDITGYPMCLCKYCFIILQNQHLGYR